MRPSSAVPLLLLTAVSGWSQSAYRKHNFNLTLGAGLPRGELRTAFSDSFLLGVGYGYRFHEYFQAETGFDTIFGAAGVRDFLPTGFGDLRIRDFQHMLPIGGAAILPFKQDRIQIQGGVGGMYLRYSERIRQPFGNTGYRFDCSVCSSRSGWGYYGRVGVTVALDRTQNFRLGVGAKVVRGETSGDPFGDVPPRQTTDRWIQIYGSFGFSF
jgi:hypothetical protein